jgi:magnesium chelatase family protein
MFCRLRSATVCGIDASIIEIEVDLKKGLPQQSIVGLPDPAVKESRERVNAAIRNSGFEFPLGSLIINLAPADLRKVGSYFDLAIAVGILLASGQIKLTFNLWDSLLLGELSLDGSLRPVRGVLSTIEKAKESGLESVLLPVQNAEEAFLSPGLAIHALKGLQDAVQLLSGENPLIGAGSLQVTPRSKPIQSRVADYTDVRGQNYAIRAVEIAAAGGHNLLLLGPPGSGKTMIASRIPGILPPMSDAESLETTKIYSAAGLLPAGTGLVRQRPFRAPHHTASDVAIIGGGRNPIPGEITLAHNGILFMDEFPEFRSNVIQALRQPLESGSVTVARADSRLRFPARFMLVASMNPCPCGYLFDQGRKCRCTSNIINRYFMKISGPILDRIDLQVVVKPLCPFDIMEGSPADATASIRRRVFEAHSVQNKRYRHEEISRNALMNQELVRQYCYLPESARDLLMEAVRRYRMSARSYYRVLRVARTIADLEGETALRVEHLLEALSYREVERILYLGTTARATS